MASANTSSRRKARKSAGVPTSTLTPSTSSRSQPSSTRSSGFASGSRSTSRSTSPTPLSSPRATLRARCAHSTRVFEQLPPISPFGSLLRAHREVIAEQTWLPYRKSTRRQSSIETHLSRADQKSGECPRNWTPQKRLAGVLRERLIGQIHLAQFRGHQKVPLAWSFGGPWGTQ